MGKTEEDATRSSQAHCRAIQRQHQKRMVVGCEDCVAWRGPGELLISAASTAAAVVVAGDVEKDLKHNPRRFVNCGK